jgi:hypothetical protein
VIRGLVPTCPPIQAAAKFPEPEVETVLVDQDLVTFRIQEEHAFLDGGEGPPWSTSASSFCAEK